MNCIYLKVFDALGLTFKNTRCIIVQLDKEKKMKITQRESSTQYDENVCLYLPSHFYPSPIFVSLAQVEHFALRVGCHICLQY
jgi:hypothetical protein